MANNANGQAPTENSVVPTKPESRQKKKDTRGCAFSYLNEEHGEMDKLCERTPEERQEEYVQPDSEKEDGGES